METDAVVNYGTSKWTFARHFLEMLLAMVLGMAIFGGAASLLLSILGFPDVLDDQVELIVISMATSMGLGMGLWMRHRNHEWSHIGEMAAAMYLPFLLLLVPYEIGVLGEGGLFMGGHVLMLPAMLGVMLVRRDVYAHDHRQHTAMHA